MTVYPTPAAEPEYADEPRRGRAYGLGMLAGAAVGVAYAVAAEVLGITWGLIAAALVGGAAIGAAVSHGAWQGRRHASVRQLQAAAALVALVSWGIGVVLAFAISQALLPQAATSLVERLSLTRFSEYFAGLDIQIRLIHAASLAAMTFFAWRGAR